MSSNPRPDPSFVEALVQLSDDDFENLIRTARNERSRQEQEPDLSKWSDEALDARCSVLAEEIASIDSTRITFQRELEEIQQIKRDRRITDVFQEDSLLRGILSFLPDSFRFTAAVNQRFHQVYLDVHDNSNKTSYKNVTETVETAKFYLDEGVDAEILCRIAASNGRLPVLRYLRSRYGYLYAWRKVCELAAGNGQLESLIWARQNGCDWDKWTCNFAAENGHLECLIWARQNGCDWDKRTCSSAAVKGHLECLIWARQNGCDWDTWTCRAAAGDGHLECLIWARQNGCDWDKWTCNFAAENGHLECLQWARQNGCDWDEWTCSSAAENGQLECLIWTRQNGCDWDFTHCIDLAARGGHNEVLEWLRLQ